MNKDELASRLKNACSAVIAAQDELTEIDSHFGDADHGVTMTKIAEAISGSVSVSYTHLDVYKRQELGIAAEDVIVASTGVIGQRMSIEPFKTGIPVLCAALGENNSALVGEAIMTTDTKLKEVAVEFTAGGKTCRLGGIAKGSGMIHPNMATMLVFLTTDCAISPEMLKKALSSDVQDTFNMVSVDGDTSTNDMVSIMANGLAGNAERCV